MIEEDPHLSIQEIADALNIGYGTAQRILTEKL